MNKILVFGSSNIDMVLNVKEMVKPGETIPCKSIKYIPGGKGANQAVACGKLGGDVTFLSAVGKDAYGQILLKNIKEAHVQTDYIREIENVPTGMAVISVDDEGENSIIIVKGANGFCDNDYYELHSDLVNSFDVVLTQFETPIDAVCKLLKDAKEKGKVTILNPAPAIDGIPNNIYESIDYLTPNETELEKLSGMKTESKEEIILAANSLLVKGIANVIVTIGREGAILVNENGSKVFPGYPVKAVDSTAAGDIFNAALAVSIAEGKSIDKAIYFGHAAASISVQREGAQTSIPSRKEVEHFFENIF